MQDAETRFKVDQRMYFDMGAFYKVMYLVYCIVYILASYRVYKHIFKYPFRTVSEFFLHLLARLVDANHFGSFKVQNQS